MCLCEFSFSVCLTEESVPLSGGHLLLVRRISVRDVHDVDISLMP